MSNWSALDEKKWRDYHGPWRLVVAALLCSLGLVQSIHEWHTDTQVSPRQPTAWGIVTENQLSGGKLRRHKYGYVFTVDGEDYMGWQEQWQSMQIGKQVVVYYDPIHPRKNALTDFHELSVTSLWYISIFGIGAVASVAFYIRQRRRKNMQR